MISPRTIERLRSSHAWGEVQAHLRDVIGLLDRNADIEGDHHAIALEVLARQRASAMLKKILEPFELYEQRPDSSGLAKEQAEDTGL